MKKGIAYTVAVLFGGVAGKCITDFKWEKKSAAIEYSRNKKDRYYRVTNQWIYNLHHGKSISDYFKTRKINTIAIYGMGVLGELLLEELENTDVSISCIIDREKIQRNYGINVKTVEESKAIEADFIVVTAVADFDSIKDCLIENGCQIAIISLEDIIAGI